MLRGIGSLLLLGGSLGLGFSVRDGLKERLRTLYRIRQIFLMLRNEILYSRASLPEACKRTAGRLEEPLKGAFLGIYEDMQENGGVAFSLIWEKNLKASLKQLSISAEDKRILTDFGENAGYMDSQAQAQAVEHYMRRLELSIKRQEEDMENKSRVIMSLSIMGGMLLVLILI